MYHQCINNVLVFRYVLGDSWFASVENMKFIANKNKFFIFDMQSNRLSAETDRNQGKWTRIDELVISNNTPIKVWLKNLEFQVFLNKQIFTNGDSTGSDF